jgi:DnaJ like chaperone protein
MPISERDDDKTIKRAYKKQMAEHHPDKLAAKGLPMEAMDIAKQKTQAIQAAYETIKSSL